MRDSHADALIGLLIFIGVLIFAIATPFILKAFRKNKASVKSNEVPEPKLVENKIIPLREKLKNTNSSLMGRLKLAIEGEKKSEALDQIEEILYTSDIGPKTVESLLVKVKAELNKSAVQEFTQISKNLKTEMQQILKPFDHSKINWNASGPTVFLVLGVNGVGKTTTIGKLSALWAKEGKRVIVAAGDTFRAAASQQLRIWSERAQVEIFAPENTKDPSGVAYEAVTKAVNEKFDVVILDTAGRLHTQSHLMDELKKIKRVITKVLPDAPHETWIVLDANSGQNALIQAREFHQAVGVTGAIVTKMDGTAKGGVIIGLHDELGIPVKKIGVGEALDDLRPFDYQEFLDAVFDS